MLHLLSALILLAAFAAPVQAQTVKALSYNTNGVVIYSSTNTLTFTNAFKFGDDLLLSNNIFNWGTNARWRPEDNTFSLALQFDSTNIAATTRTNLGLGATNIVTFAGLTNNGNVTINGNTATNGLLFVYRTNNEAFLGMANLIASNNTTISNETLFRVGVQEATNKAAQFGFRSTNTNGSGVAVFSVFGFNALMQIGADASTNAVIFSGGGTNNQVMTLIKNGATEFSRPVAWNNTTNAAATRTNLSLPLSSLTNTSNVTMMRALAGSTNTNEPFSGIIAFLDSSTNARDITISNGIIVNIEAP
jgi:hypothetical protein